MTARRANRRKGAALLIVLFAALLLSSLILIMTASVRVEGRIAAARAERLKADLALASALDLAAYEIARGDPSASERREVLRDIALNGYTVTVTRESEAPRLDVNRASEAEWAALLQEARLESEPAEHLAARIADWRDADDLSRPNGAEGPDYRAKDLAIGDRPFRSVAEVSAVLGFDEKLALCLAPRLTVLGEDQPVSEGTGAGSLGTAARGAAPGRVFLLTATARRDADGRSRKQTGLFRVTGDAEGGAWIARDLRYDEDRKQPATPCIAPEGGDMRDAQAANE